MVILDFVDLPRGRPAARADVLRAPVLPVRRPVLRGAGAALLLVQLAVRRLPGLHRHRHPDGGRPGADRPRRGEVARRGRDRTPGRSATPRSTSPRLVGALAEELGFRTDIPWAGLPQRARKALLYGHKTQVAGRYRNRYGRERSYTTGLRGRGALRQAAALRGGDRLQPGALRGLHARGALPDLRGHPAQADRAGRHRRGASPSPTSPRMSISDCAEFLRALKLTARDKTDRRAGAQGGQRAAAVPGRRRPGLPLAQPRGRHPVRRRGAAHPAGHPDRLRPGRRALRAGRAVHRPAPARQPPADRDPGPAARPGQHPDRRRARRGHHQDRRLGRRHRPRRRRARRQGGALRLARGAAGQRGVADRRSTCPGKRSHPDARTSAARSTASAQLTVHGAREHNLQDVDVSFPLGVLHRGHRGLRLRQVHAGQRHPLHPPGPRAERRPQRCPAGTPGSTGDDLVDKVVHVDQSPIGRTPRSNPATYTGVFDHVRRLFAETTEAKVRGYLPGRFSFNVKGGRCENCSGDGTIKIEMNFLPDVYVPCEVCHGARYNRETLEVHYKGKSIAEVLDMPIEEALEFFEAVPADRPPPAHPQRRRPRLRPARPDRADAVRRRGTAGQAGLRAAEALHRPDRLRAGRADHRSALRGHQQAASRVLSGLVDKGNTVIVIEHNLDVIKTADWVVDMGPEGGSGGGLVVAEGTPEQVAAVPASHTGKFLRDDPGGRLATPRPAPDAARCPAAATGRTAAARDRREARPTARQDRPDAAATAHRDRTAVAAGQRAGRRPPDLRGATAAPSGGPTAGAAVTRRTSRPRRSAAAGGGTSATPVVAAARALKAFSAAAPTGLRGRPVIAAITAPATAASSTRTGPSSHGPPSVAARRGSVTRRRRRVDPGLTPIGVARRRVGAWPTRSYRPRRDRSPTRPGSTSSATSTAG